MSQIARTVLPTGSSPLERAVDAGAQSWEGLSGAVRPVDGEHHQAFGPWLAAEWGFADFAKYFETTEALIAAGVPWLLERGTAAGVKRALSWVGFTNTAIDQDGAWLHIDLGRVATNEELARVVHVVRATVPAHVFFYRVYWAWDLRTVRLDARPVLDAGILDNESGALIEFENEEPIRASFGSLHLSELTRQPRAPLRHRLVSKVQGALIRLDTLRLDAWALDSEFSPDAFSAMVTHMPIHVPAPGFGAGDLISMPVVYLDTAQQPGGLPGTATTTVVKVEAPRPIPLSRGWEGTWDQMPWAANSIPTKVTTEII